ncbi:RNA polymerase sigma factor [Streptomyces neyagawaensis]|uniref:RNA polymerase sigma factor n=1 Tax=Streptomyces neyagawaensis TaxID=42238 RepID=UPI00201D0926|nr:sigma-70 family RNA polymerase sigma factor [Streptomyces neyagawaensis]MCL6734198.1 sigma-70 family RNA polymerase sigma factor [Streptomyces neyagawaensis]MDE1681132.1 sigma-70 family RNA polymerase sigma factor [Streptomyces neyagawaensis]
MTETQAPTEAEATCAAGVASETASDAGVAGETAGDAGVAGETAGETGCDAGSAGEVEWYQQPLSTDAEAAADPALAPPPLTPAQAFDALYSYCAPTLVQQTYLLTGSLRQARDAVERAFQQAWQRWPEVAVDRDPAGWLRAVAHDCALSPWHRLRHRLPVPFRGPESEPEPEPEPGPGPAPTSAPTDPTGRALLAELQRLRPPYRRALVLYDGVGLDLPETAAETEASTPATAGRVQYARAVVTAYLPEPTTPEELHRLLNELAADVRPRPTLPIVLRTRADLRARRWIHAAVVFASVLLTTTALTLRTAPDHYEPPVPPGDPVSGVPPQVVPGPLSHKQLKLRSKLRAATAAGPERLHPEAR